MMLRYDPVYQDIMNRCRAHLQIIEMRDIDRYNDNDIWRAIPGQSFYDVSWHGEGNLVAFSGELLRELDYTHPQIQFDSPLLKIGGYLLRWIEWWEEYDLAVFERVTIYGYPVIPYQTQAPE